jgi:hypothetical protein
MKNKHIKEDYRLHEEVNVKVYFSLQGFIKAYKMREKRRGNIQSLLKFW